MQPQWWKIREGQLATDSYLMREAVVDAIRFFFKQRGFLEVETPLLVKAPGMEPYLEVFETELVGHDQTRQRAFLTTSPEYAMKKLLVAGLPRIFQICKSFRNGEDLMSSTHNPEFTILEWYRANTSYFEIMDDCENLLRYIFDYRAHIQSGGKIGVVAENVNEVPRILKYQGKELNLSLPWERITVAEAFLKYAQVGIDDLLDENSLRKIFFQKGYLGEDASWEQMYNQIFLNEVEPFLGITTPTILYEYPTSQAALSRKKQDDQRFAERFEFYIFGKELGNAFGELTDAAEQEARLRAEYEERKLLGKKMYEIDWDFVNALKVGMPEAGGIAVGVDRLVMLFADVGAIQQTLWFPAQEVF